LAFTTISAGALALSRFWKFRAECHPDVVDGTGISRAVLEHYATCPRSAEHRLFSFIAITWRGRALTDIRTIVQSTQAGRRTWSWWSTIPSPSPTGTSARSNGATPCGREPSR